MPDFSPNNASNQAIELIAPTTGIATSEGFYIPDGKVFTIFADVLASGETVAIEAMKPDGTWISIKDDVLSGTDSRQENAFYSKGIFRAAKTATAGSVGVYAFGGAFYQAGRK